MSSIHKAYEEIPIKEIIIKDRIRENYGDILALANDIKKNGLINPVTITPEFQLIAGERRLKAYEHLGFNTIPARIIEIEDYENILNIEIAENELRKDFSMLEKLKFAKELEQIEVIKARERMRMGSPNSDKVGRVDEIVAKKSGIGGRDTYRKGKYIADNADEETIEAWDKGVVSTNKAYESTKNVLEPKNLEVASIEKELTPEEKWLKDEYKKIDKEHDNHRLVASLINETKFLKIDEQAVDDYLRLVAVDCFKTDFAKNCDRLINKLNDMKAYHDNLNKIRRIK